jgi:hypothetical protein
VLLAEDMWFTTWRLAPILRPYVRDEIRERRESSSSQEVADGGSAIAKTTGGRKTELGSLTCWRHKVVCYFSIGIVAAGLVLL